MKRIIADIFLLLSIIGLLYTKYIDISIYNGKPDLLLIFTVLLGLFEGGYHSIIFGFAGGLVLDFVGGTTPLGFNAFIYTIIGYISIIPHKFFQIESPAVAPLIMVVFFIIKTFVFMITGYIFLSHDEIVGYMNSVLLSEGIYTVVVSIFVFIVFKSIFKFMEKLRKHV